jgi:AraC-like DNA-binding protein
LERRLTPLSKYPARATVSCATQGVSSHIAPVYLIPLVAAVDRAGIDADALFFGLGLDVGDLSVPGFTVSPDEANTVVRRALHLLQMPSLGLTLGMNTRITERGAMALGLMAAATLGDAIALTVQYPGCAGYLLPVHVEHSKRLHLVVIEPGLGNDDIAPFLVDIMFAGSVRMRRQVTESHYAPTSLDLVRPRPANAAVYEQFFACPIRFGCERNVLASDLAWLALALPMANTMAYRLSLQLLEREVDRPRTASLLRLAVERAISRALTLDVTLAGLASSLNLSERSLRRRLAQEGLSFRSMLDEARKARVLALINREGRSLAHIALQTGFSDVRAFSRAVKRWTGHPPSALHLENTVPGN